MLELQPLGGAPDLRRAGDARSSRVLREAARLGFRSGAGPFRSFGSLSPRPYQLVPLLLALQLDPLGLLIADDVGIGKTVEAALIARELLERGDIQSFAVLCPPYLAQQWADELREKFNIEAGLALSSTASRLEQGCNVGQSLFHFHPFTVVSLDFIKTERRRAEFLRACPDLVIAAMRERAERFGGEHGGKHHARLPVALPRARQRRLSARMGTFGCSQTSARRGENWRRR